MSIRLLYLQQRKKYRSKLFLIPHGLTYLNACSGFLAMVCAIQEHFVIAAWFIACAIFFDACDGRVARALGVTSFLGAELDALADAISFCCAPALLTYLFYQEDAGVLLLFSLLFFLCAGLFRLARFNTHKNFSTRYFSGLPSPMAAGTLSTLIMQIDSMGGICHESIVDQRVTSLCIIALALLMMSTIPFDTCKTSLYSKELFFFILRLCVGSGIFWLFGCHGLLAIPCGYLLSCVGSWFVKIIFYAKNNF